MGVVAKNFALSWAPSFLKSWICPWCTKFHAFIIKCTIIIRCQIRSADSDYKIKIEDYSSSIISGKHGWRLGWRALFLYKNLHNYTCVHKLNFLSPDYVTIPIIRIHNLVYFANTCSFAFKKIFCQLVHVIIVYLRM